MIVILTGAGISQESGIATFRDAGGLWENVRVEDVATPRAFAKDPERVLAFYNLRRRHLLSAAVAPHAAHLALARLERELGETVLLVTQNVDDLHERAGSVNLLHMHGELLKARCTHCDAVFRFEGDMSRDDACPKCRRTRTLRPHIVWFEEMPFHMDVIYDALAQCRMFVSIGTSGNVYPAAGFAAEARKNGAHIMELNLEATRGGNIFHEGRYGRAGEIVPAWVDELLEKRKR